MGGLGQGHLPFFFSKNRRLARKAGKGGRAKRKGFGGKEFLPARPVVWGWESVSAIPASAGRQSPQKLIP